MSHLRSVAAAGFTKDDVANIIPAFPTGNVDIAWAQLNATGLDCASVSNAGGGCEVGLLTNSSQRVCTSTYASVAAPGGTNLSLFVLRNFRVSILSLLFRYTRVLVLLVFNLLVLSSFTQAAHGISGATTLQGRPPARVLLS